jgi:hypothetical protein
MNGYESRIVKAELHRCDEVECFEAAKLRLSRTVQGEVREVWWLCGEHAVQRAVDSINFQVMP